MADLITLEKYREYRGINSTDRDGKIQALISQTSALIEHYCNRNFTDFVDTDKTEWFDAKTDLINLTVFPLISVTSVKTSVDGGITQVDLTVNDPSGAGYFVDLECGQIRTQQTGYKFLNSYNTPYRSLEVAYRAGYAEVPKDLELAALDLVVYYLDQQSKPNQSLMGASIENPLPYLANSFPPHIRRVLDLYRYSS